MAKFEPRVFFAAHRKKLLVAVILLAVTALGLGVWYYAANNSRDPVYVYPFHYVGMTEYWGDSQESYGPVSSDNIQTVFLSETQKVTEILVKAGDTVKKGDLLMSFDTTLDSLKLERKRLEVEKVKLELEAAQNHMLRIKNMVPMQVITHLPEDTYDESLGEYINASGMEVYEGIEKLNYDGSSENKPLVLWLAADRGYSSSMDDELRRIAGELQWINLQHAQEETPPEEEDGETEDPGTQPPEEGSEQPPEEGTEQPPEEGTEQPPEEGTEQPPEEGTEQPPEGENGEDGSGGTNSVTVDDFYVVIRVTKNDQKYAAQTTWAGLHVTYNGIFFFTPAISDPFMAEYDGTGAVTTVNIGSGYTAAQIAQMWTDQEKKIKDLEFQVKVVETDYKLMEKEFSDGNIYAQVDGQVVSVLTEEEARSSRQPVVKVSGGGGFYVEGYVSELDKEQMELGMTVTVNDWNTGKTYDAHVDSVGDFPAQEEYYSGMGNPNASFYPFRVFVDGSADLQTGSFVSIMYSTNPGGNGLYLENPYIRTEGAASYVLVRGADGTLEQRFVTTGKSLWGNYTEIRSGLAEEDLVAFPYGKHVKPGAKTVEGDLGDLYG